MKIRATINLSKIDKDLIYEVKGEKFMEILITPTKSRHSDYVIIQGEKFIGNGNKQSWEEK